MVMGSRISKMYPSSRSLESLRNTESIVPARSPPNLEPLPKLDVPTKGRNILLIIPTSNQDKQRVIKEYVESRTTPGLQVHTETIPADSEVGEQPYNDAGAQGASNRIANSLKKLQGEQISALIEKHDIGTVIVGAIENFIQTEGVSHPVDQAVAIVHNASAGKTTTAFSRGVTLNLKYIKWAKARGFVHGNRDHGEETVGNILAAKFPGLDSANWHEVMAGVSRYTLLREALENLPLSWQ